MRMGSNMQLTNFYCGDNLTIKENSRTVLCVVTFIICATNKEGWRNVCGLIARLCQVPRLTVCFVG